jgi:serine/threonine protein kinase
MASPLALTPGSRFGPYEVSTSIDVGGMGEVFRARNTKLHREVAIKVLPAAVAYDPERRERFERAAQTIAALNHPNFVTIHAVGRLRPVRGASPRDAEHVVSGWVPASGENAGDDAFLAMEMVEGRPLSEVIPRGGMKR